jgi:superkiller protein 3
VNLKRAQGLPGWERLLDVARRADADPWRNRLRDAFRRYDSKALKELARDRRLLAQPRATLRLLGTWLARSGQVPLAVRVLRQAQRRHPDDFWFNFLLGNFLLGKYLTKRSPAGPGEAIGFYRAAVALHPQSSAAHANLGAALSRQGNAKEAVAQCRRAVELNPDSPVARGNLGRALADLGRPEEALAECRRAVALRPGVAAFHYNLGNALSRALKLDEAVAAYHRALALEPDYAKAHYNLGIVLRQQKKPGEAVVAYRKAIALGLNSPEPYIGLGNALAEQKKLGEAEAAFRKAIALKRDDALPHYNLGNALYGQKKLEEAVKAYRRAIDLQPDYADACFNLGNALHAQNKLDEAIKAYRRAIDLRPKYAEAHCNLGQALPDRGEFAQALTQRRRGHELGSRNPRWPYPSARWVRESEHLVELKARLDRGLDGQEAAAAARAYLAGLPAEERRACVRLWGTIHLNLGNAYCNQGKLDQAIAAYRKALVLEPDRTAAHNNLGIVLRQQGKLDEAIAAYSKVIELEPDNLAARTSRGAVYAALGQWEKAAADLTPAVRAQAPSEVWVEVACLRLLRGDVAGYRQLCRQTAPHADKSKNPYLAHVASRTCMLSPEGPIAAPRAVKWAEQAVAAGKSAWHLHALGRAHYRAGQLEQAVRRCRESLRAEPDWPGRMLNWLVLAMAHQRLGEGTEARCWLDKAVRWRHALPRGRDRTGAIAPPGLHTADWLEFQALVREAETLVKGSGAKEPAGKPK